MPFITQGKTNWKFLLIVIILAIVVGGGSLWYAKRPEQPYQPPEIKKVDETANWKTYTNERFGFEFKYPENWSEGVVCGMGTCEGTFCPKPGKVDVCPQVYSISESYKEFLDISVYPIKSFNEYLKEVRNLFHRTDFPATFNNQLISEKELTIAGINAVERIVQYSNEETAASSFNWIGKKMIEVHIPLGTDNIIKFYAPDTETNIFNQILSSFKFLK